MVREGGDMEWQWPLWRWKMAAVDDDSGGRQQWQRRTMTTATADDDSSKQQQQWTTTARKIGQRTKRRKEKSGRRTTTALELAGQRAWKNKEIEFTQKDFFWWYGLSGWIFCSHQNTQWYLLDLSVLIAWEQTLKKKPHRTTSENRVALFQNSLRFFSADFRAVSAVTSLSAVFFEMGSLVGFVVLEFPWDFLQCARKLSQDPPTQHNNNISETSQLSQVETSSFLQTSPPCHKLQSVAHWRAVVATSPSVRRIRTSAGPIWALARLVRWGRFKLWWPQHHCFVC